MNRVTDPPAATARAVPPAARPAASSELQALLDATVDAIVIIDHRGHIEVFNRSAERLFGYTAPEVAGRNVSMLMTDRDRDSHDAYVSRYLETGVAHIIGIGRDVVARRKDGSTFSVFLSVGRIAGTDPPRFVGLLHDTTIREEAMRSVRRERDRANQYLEVAQTVLVALDAGRRIALVNRKGCEVLGRREAELVGCDWLDTAVAREDRAAALAQLEQLRELSGSPHYCEYHVSTGAGDRRLIAWRCIRVEDSVTGSAGLLCSGEDVTEQRRSEQEARQSQERLTHVSRLATLGEMAAGIAHELNQPLAAIATYAQASRRLLEAGAANRIEVDGALEQIASQALRAGEVIRRLRSLVRNQETQREPTDPNDLIRELRTLTEADARLHEARVIFELAPALPRVDVDRIQIQQVLLNLLRNAIEALEGNPLDRREIRIDTRLVQGDRVELRVRDTGPGVEPRILQRMFDPFCTTKTAGTGLGLAISRTIIEAHDGRLSHEANLPTGACFCISLPSFDRGAT